MTIKTYIAPTIAAANQFVREYENLTLSPDVPTAAASIITGYKIELDTERMVYTSYVQRRGAPAWIERSINKPVSQRGLEGLAAEVRRGSLVEETASPANDLRNCLRYFRFKNKNFPNNR